MFTPGAPVNAYQLFAGRFDQVVDVVAAINQRGMHVVMYGERGVGKTSVANVMAEVLMQQNVHLRCVMVNCAVADDFAGLWGSIFERLDLTGTMEMTPEGVRRAIENVTARNLIVIDELDRLEDEAALTQLADTIKTLSDHSVLSTLMLIGVADSVDQLLGAHQSIERALTQVLMPRMSIDELKEIVDKGLNQLGMTIDRAAKDRVAMLSEGLPSYTHLLALHATSWAVADDRSHVEDSDVEHAIGAAVQKAQQSIKSAYQKATRSPRPGNLFTHVLTACALAPKDDLGYFTAGSVRAPMKRITNRDYDIPAFAAHLNAFTTDERGAVLRCTGEQRRHFYRFEDPMLQPYAILTALAKGLITEQQLKG
ncbi:MAG TPA: ATP-binding protein [Candidatus Angelobacter sp.]|nr:ATP-binding protein [Candidatus Angelobacter sp.]